MYFRLSFVSALANMYTIACARFRAQTKIGCSKLQAPAGGNSRRRLLTTLHVTLLVPCPNANLLARNTFLTRFARHLGDGALIPSTLIRSVFEPHAHLCEDETTRRSAKLAQRAFAPALASRGAYLRPRKLDEKLSRHGLGARRVALLAPRATFSLYWYPLDYVSARLKLFQEVFS